MIDLTTCNEWQKYDEATGCVFPWLTFPALDEISTWDLSDKTVLEIGGGASTIWWNKKAKVVVTYEDSLEYRKALKKLGIHTEKLKYFFTPKFNVFVDVAIIDNDYERDGYIKKAFRHLKPNGRLVVDNWCQKSVDWQPSKEIQDLVLSCNHKIFKQPNHPDWSTLICYL